MPTPPPQTRQEIQPKLTTNSRGRLEIDEPSTTQNGTLKIISDQVVDLLPKMYGSKARRLLQALYSHVDIDPETLRIKWNDGIGSNIADMLEWL